MSLPIDLYMRPWCPFCVRAKQLLQAKGLAFNEINLDQEPGRMQEMLDRSRGRRTVPQIFIGDVHVGGCDDLYALERDGQLDPLLT